MSLAHETKPGAKQHLAAHGFAVFPGVVSRSEIACLLGGLESNGLSRSRAGFRHAMRNDAVAAFAHDSRLVSLAAEILGPTPIPFRATLFDKSPTSNWLVVWHQDTALPIRERRDVAGWGPWSTKDGIAYAHAPSSALENVVALRLHLDDSTEDNGPLRVLPGTHSHGVLEDHAIHQLASKITPVDCLVPLGGIIAMKPLIVHASSKSRSPQPRRVLHIEYASSLDLPDGLELALA
jgi:ectoine hydroxylase-related dioxygenase (phytanoyl-CoA dioxygenase family)